MVLFKYLFRDLTHRIIFYLFSDEANTIFEIANTLGLVTHEYIWILTKSVIESQLYGNFKFNKFPIGSLGKRLEN